jgi:hypothetical protein
VTPRPGETRVLTRRDVARVLGVRDCIEAVERAFRRHADAGVATVCGVAAAWLVYERAVVRGVGIPADLGGADAPRTEVRA